jgi:diguanylate cyclase (GGDEF)-like protein
MEAMPLTVLVIDDDSGDVELLQRHLEKIPDFIINLIVCTSTAAGQAVLMHQSIDLIFLDYLLGAQTGLDLIHTLRQRGDRRPVIILTGQGDQRIAAATMRAGADDYVLKEDLNPDTLRRSLRFVLERAEDERRRVQIEAELIRLARFDELTGLYNRRYLLERLEQEVLRAKRYGPPLCLIMLDLDHFKHINDTYGHLIGDHVLARVGSALRNTIRATDVAGRYGGEEFCIVLTETSLQGACATAERLRQCIAAAVFTADDRTTFHATCSLGVAAYTPDLPDVHELLMRADRALYKAKAAGRNRVMLAST